MLAAVEQLVCVDCANLWSEISIQPVWYEHCMNDTNINIGKSGAAVTFCVLLRASCLLQ